MKLTTTVLREKRWWLYISGDGGDNTENKWESYLRITVALVRNKIDEAYHFGAVEGLEKNSTTVVMQPWSQQCKIVQIQLLQKLPYGL